MTQPAQRSRLVMHDSLRAAVEARHAPRAPGAVANTFTFGWRALLKIKHTPEQLFDVVITPIMFTVLFTYLFGGALAGSPRDYLQFLLPGILVQTVAFSSIYTGFTLNTDLSKGVFDRFRSMPLWRPSPLAGAMLGDVGRYTATALVVLIVGVVLGFRPPAGLVGVFASIVLLNVFALGIGWVFTSVALAVRTPGTVMTLSWVVMMPLTFASNIYVDPQTMPGWLQAFVSVNPVAHVVTAIRGLMAGVVDPQEIGLALLSPALTTVLCAPIAMRLYQRER